MIDYCLPFPPSNKYMPANTLCVFPWGFGTRLKTNGENKGLTADARLYFSSFILLVMVLHCEDTGLIIKF